MVAHRQRFAVNNGIDGAKAAVMHCDIPTVSHLEGCPLEGTFGKTHLFTSSFIDLMAGRHFLKAIRIEPVQAASNDLDKNSLPDGG